MEARLQEILLQVSRSPAIDAGDEALAIRLVLDSICEGLHVERAGVWFIEDAGQAMRCRLLVDHVNRQEHRDLLLQARTYPRYFAALQSERAIVADDAQRHPMTAEFTRDYLLPLNIGAMLDLPIRHHGRMIGIICCEHIGTARPWSASEASFAAGLADIIGRAINARETREALERVARLNGELEARVAERTAALQQAQRQLLDSEKLAALGRIVAGVAHELDTPLGNALLMASSLRELHKPLQAELAAGQVRRHTVTRLADEGGTGYEILLRNLQRASGLIVQFKQVAVDQTSEQRRGFDAARVSREVLSTLEPSLRRSGCRLDVELGPELQCDSYPGPFGQVLANLVMNSMLHAFEGRPAGTIRVQLEAHDPDHLRLTVADDGAGMSAEVQRQAFEPFFTTRLGRGGSGLGMSIVQGLVMRVLGGVLELQTAPGQGCRTTVLFPRIAPLRAAAEGAE